jgi:hypothetical protein
MMREKTGFLKFDEPIDLDQSDRYQEKERERERKK